MTADELLAAINGLGLDGVVTKNLFVKSKKKRDDNDSQLWLVVAARDTQFRLDDLAVKLEYPKKCKFRFADEAILQSHLGVAQGSVTPLALVNDAEGVVNVAIDAVLAQSAKLHVHP
eukprot:CAMPEP_0182479098 /NCGR_PEP_ID=MMETSP1319-20130603/33610_1 /TAXON_ID=172717 /ORGANISM="Bolidomonas pacifica, Strain RCC208" /LENGTH=116 /DNA_ID=CAMNT_0024680501 /DNA_START=42 /DNA_END=388 /DNA_ORIENTATION=+